MIKLITAARFCNTRLIIPPSAFLRVALLFLLAETLLSQPITQLFRSEIPSSPTDSARACLPKTPEDIDREIQRMEKRLADARRQMSGTRQTQTPGFAENLAEREQLVRRWVIAL